MNQNFNNALENHFTETNNDLKTVGNGLLDGFFILIQTALFINKCLQEYKQPVFKIIKNVEEKKDQSAKIYIEIIDQFSDSCSSNTVGNHKDNIPNLFNALCKASESFLPITLELSIGKKYELDKIKISYIQIFARSLDEIEPFGTTQLINKKMFEKGANDLFIDDNVKKRLVEKFNLYYESYLDLYCDEDRKTGYFPLASKIEKNLENYQELLKTIFFINEGFLESGIVKSGILEAVLNPGFEKTKNEKSHKVLPFGVSFKNPYCLDSLYAVYKNIECFYPVLNCSNDEISTFHENAFLMKIMRKFRHYAQVENQLILVGLFPGNERLISGIKVAELNGIEKIHPIRLLEKIIISIKNAHDSYFNGMKFRISILGTLESKEEYEKLLKTMLKVPEVIDFIEDYNSEINLVWFTKDDDLVDFNFDERNIKAKVEKKEYAFSTRFFDQLIKDNELVFILDCPELYLPDRLLEKEGAMDFSSYLGKFTYLDDYEYKEINKRIYNRSMVAKLYNQMVVRSFDPLLFYGKPFRPLNSKIIRYIESKLEANEELSYQSVYVYVSSREGFNESQFRKRNVTREEKYNGKHIQIIRLSNRINEPPILAGGVSKDDLRIAFTLWQIIKNTRVKMVDAFVKMLGFEQCDTESAIVFLKNVFFAMDYSRYKDNKIIISYGVNKENKVVKDLISVDENQEERLNEHISNIASGIAACVFKFDENMHIRCFKDTLLTILYSGSKSVSDLLFYYLYSKGVMIEGDRDLVIETKEEINASDLKTCFEKNKGLFGQKRMYAELFKNCDRSNFSSFNQIEAAGEIVLNKGSIQEVIKNTKIACNNLDYRNSIIENNIIAMGRWQ